MFARFKPLAQAVYRNRFTIGMISGGVATVGGSYYFGYEKIFGKQIQKTYNSRLSLIARANIYKRLSNFVSDSITYSNKKFEHPRTLEDWSSLIVQIQEKMEESYLISLSLQMRNDLYQAIQELDDPFDQISILLRITPDSYELNHQINQALEESLERDKYLQKSLLLQIAEDRNFKCHQFSLMENILVQKAILLFPHKDIRFLEFLKDLSNLKSESLLANYPGFQVLQKYFLQNDTQLQRELMRSSIELILDQLEMKPDLQVQYQTQVEEFLKEKLGNAPIIKPNLEIALGTFFKLPTSYQSSLLVTLINHQFEVNSENEKNIIQDMINDLGVVAIKMSQMMAENPNTPLEYQKLFKQFRSSNQKVPVLEFWNQIPISVQRRITHLGKRIGTGSIKQVHKIKVHGHPDQELIIAVHKPGILDDTISTLNALSEIEAVSGLKNKLMALIYQEYDLHLEYRAFREMENFESNYDLKLVVPEIVSESNRHIIRAFVKGESFEELVEDLDNFPIFKFQNFCRFIFEQFFNKHLILSDLHYGNMINLPDNQISIIDPGQITSITNSELNVLTCLLTILTQDSLSFRQKKSSFLFHKMKIVIPDLEEEHFNELYQKQVQHQLPKHRFMGLVNELEKNHHMVPDSFFAFGKMYDIMDSQLEMLPGDYTIKNLVEEFKSSFASSLGWNDVYNLKL